MKPVCGDEGWGCQEASGGQQGCAGRAASGEGKRCARRLFLQPHSLQPRAPELGREKGSCPPAPSPAASSPLPARRKRTRPHHEAHPRQETVPQAKMGNSPPRQLPPPPFCFFLLIHKQQGARSQPGPAAGTATHPAGEEETGPGGCVHTACSHPGGAAKTHGGSQPCTACEGQKPLFILPRDGHCLGLTARARSRVVKEGIWIPPVPGAA